MRFNFCGNLTVPEWFLSQLPQLSNLSALKLRKLCNLQVQHILTSDNLAQNGPGKTHKSTIGELLDNANFSKKDSKSVLAVISFILMNAVKNSVSGDTLNKEQIDLGIPKENCTSIIKIFNDSYDKLSTFYKNKVPMNNQVEMAQIYSNTILKSSGNCLNSFEYYDIGFDKFFTRKNVVENEQEENNDADAANDEEEKQEDLQAKGNLFNDKKRVLEVRMSHFMMGEFRREMKKANEILLNLEKL